MESIEKFQRRKNVTLSYSFNEKRRIETFLKNLKAENEVSNFDKTIKSSLVLKKCLEMRSGFSKNITKKIFQAIFSLRWHHFHHKTLIRS